MSDVNQKRAGVIGWPVEHSLSPRVHGYWLDFYKIEGIYEKIPVLHENLSSFLKNLPAKKYRGVNLTIPHKEAALKIVDEVEEVALKVGAINTIVVEESKLIGKNTDVFGFTENLRLAGYKDQKKPVTLLGAGGAARAALVALLESGVSEIRIVNRTLERAEALRKVFGDKISLYAWGDGRAFEDTSLLVNATSLGLKGQPPLVVSLKTLPTTAWVMDMVYVPLDTPFLKQAAIRGNKTVDGLGMLLHQARPAFKAFFGRDPEVTSELRHFVLKEK